MGTKTITTCNFTGIELPQQTQLNIAVAPHVFNSIAGPLVAVDFSPILTKAANNEAFEVTAAMVHNQSRLATDKEDEQTITFMHNYSVMLTIVPKNFVILQFSGDQNNEDDVNAFEKKVASVRQMVQERIGAPSKDNYFAQVTDVTGGAIHFSMAMALTEPARPYSSFDPKVLESIRSQIASQQPAETPAVTGDAQKAEPLEGEVIEKDK